jgi:hypothetical protein
MGLISDRTKSKKQKEKEKEFEKLKNAQNNNNKTKNGLKKGLVVPAGGPGMMRYPAGYYTAPGPASWAHTAHGHHASQPKMQPNLNPRYQTWVAPRKQQPHLNQLVSSSKFSKFSDNDLCSDLF